MRGKGTHPSLRKTGFNRYSLKLLIYLGSGNRIPSGKRSKMFFKGTKLRLSGLKARCINSSFSFLDHFCKTKLTLNFRKSRQKKGMSMIYRWLNAWSIRWLCWGMINFITDLRMFSSLNLENTLKDRLSKCKSMWIKY